MGEEIKFTRLKKIIVSVLGVIALFVVLSLSGKIFEHINADEILCIQDPYDGELHWYTSAGLKWQGFGAATVFKKRAEYNFSCLEREEITEKDAKGQEYKKTICKPDKDGRIKVRFAEGGHAMMDGSIQYELPLDPKLLTAIRERFPDIETLQTRLIERVVYKSVYLTGPFMTSKESYSEKRNDLIRLVEDQILNGIIKTFQQEEKIRDPLSGQEKTATVIKPIIGKDGFPERQEAPQLTPFGIKPFNFAISDLAYDETVEAQIQQQQQLAMQVQTSIASAKMAEQNAITVAEQGKATAAQEKWKQEAIKAKEVTAAEQRKEVAKIDKEAAEFRKMATILDGQGEAEKRRLIMAADGALQLKGDIVERIVGRFAQEFSKQKWVPEVLIINGTAQGGYDIAGSQMQNFMNLLSIQAMKSLGLDLSVPQGKTRTGQ